MDARIWSHILQAAPVPIPGSVTSALEQRLCDPSNDAYVHDVGERLAKAGHIQTLRILVAKGGHMGDGLRPFVAAAGDQPAVAQELAKLRATLEAGGPVRGSDASWLVGATDSTHLDGLFTCLRLAGERRAPGGDNYGDPSGPLVAAIRRVGTEGALERYDALLAEEPEPFPSVKFLRLSRQTLLEDLLREAAGPAITAMLQRVSTPDGS